LLHASKSIEQLREKFEDSCKLQTGVYVTFTKLKIAEPSIFKNICQGCVRIQQCSDFDKTLIFGSPPEDKDLNLLGLLEETFDCAGLCGVKLDKYFLYFPNLTRSY